jgi:hypothetical protein
MDRFPSNSFSPQANKPAAQSRRSWWTLPSGTSWLQHSPDRQRWIINLVVNVAEVNEINGLRGGG